MDCQLWEGPVTAEGYGVTYMPGVGTVRAHRLAFFLANGHWPKVCRHSCDTPACLNPAHLLDGTQLDNIADRQARRRHAGHRLTHCKRGHPLPPPGPDGWRHCAACKVIRQRERRAARR